MTNYYFYIKIFMYQIQGKCMDTSVVHAKNIIVKYGNQT